MDIKDIANIIIDHVIDNERIYERSFYEKIKEAAKEILDKIHETFIQEIAVLDLKPNSILVLYSNEPHTVKDALFAMRKMVRERFPELKDTAILILRPGDDIKLLDEKQMNKIGWYKHKSLSGGSRSLPLGGFGGVDDVS